VLFLQLGDFVSHRLEAFATLSANFLAFGFASFGVGGTGAVIGLFEFVMRFGHFSYSITSINWFRGQNRSLAKSFTA
jgi:hypothetical protein